MNPFIPLLLGMLLGNLFCAFVNWITLSKAFPITYYQTVAVGLCWFFVPVAA